MICTSKWRCLLRMQRKKKIPDSPRFSFVTKTAYEFLLECGYEKFPISPYDVLDEMKEYVTCLPWSEAQKILRSDDPFHLKQQNAEGRTIRMRDTGKYYIVYDDVTIKSPDRISWTIMHEIGHVILGHLVEFGETALNRGGITNEQYGVLEVEAHYFAAEFLMPTAILKYLNGITVDQIALLFGVSDKAAGKKYKRVFETSYLPYDRYEEKLIRNFYNFILLEASDAIYRSIYRMWRKPRKNKYVSVCRKCPSCLSYINDPKAEYCSFCGELIEQHRSYKNTSERLKARQRFIKRPGVFHLGYPYVERKKASNGEEYERITVCATCLNHGFSEHASSCPICGQPLENHNHEEGNIKSVADCFSRSSGRENTSNAWYPAFEKRYRRIMSYRGALLCDDWVEYPYWEFTKWMLRESYEETSMDLQAGLLYSTAFMDDEDNIHIVTDTVMARDAIQKEQEILLSYLKRTDDIERREVEVLAAHDL